MGGASMRNPNSWCRFCIWTPPRPSIMKNYAFISSSFKINRIQNLTNEFEGELEQLLSLSETTIACPCGNYTFTENIFPNVENTYVCEKCNNEFKLDVTVTPTLLTQPVNVDQPINALKGDVEITSEYKQGTEL